MLSLRLLVDLMSHSTQERRNPITAPSHRIIARSPSLLQKLKSINLYQYISPSTPDQPQLRNQNFKSNCHLLLRDEECAEKRGFFSNRDLYLDHSSFPHGSLVGPVCNSTWKGVPLHSTTTFLTMFLITDAICSILLVQCIVGI
ncbi:hypothetical protein TB1_013659 [Malus domestica]